MKSRALRYALATLFVGVLGGAAYVTWTEESEATATAAAARRFDDRARLVSRALLDIKSAQPGYVAAGQGDDFWTAKIDGLMGPAREGFTALRAQARTAQGQAEIENAAAAFEDFEQMDRRAREYARSGQRLLASDLVFSDGLDKMDGAVAALDRARVLELAASDAGIEFRRRRQWMATGGAAALAILTLLLLIPLPPEPGSAAVPRPAHAEPAADYPIARRESVVAAPPPPSPPPAAPPPPVAQAATASVDFGGIASLCTELARVADTLALPAALERAARLLHASGIVIWVADPDGRELTPVIAHGYPQAVLARMGTIEREAENVTAAAFRTGLVQTVKSDAISAGAIAAPLLTPAGPIGVMAAEVLDDGERHAATRAAAAIVAAQLATLVAPPARAQGKAVSAT